MEEKAEMAIGGREPIRKKYVLALYTCLTAGNR